MGSDPVGIFDQSTEKGVKNAKDEGHVLYHRDALLGDFNGKSEQQIVSQTSTIFGNIHNLKQTAEQAEEQKMKASTQNTQN